VHKTVSCSKNVHTLQISCNRLLAPTVNFHDFVIKLSKSDSRLVKNKTLPATTHINVTHTDIDNCFNKPGYTGYPEFCFSACLE